MKDRKTIQRESVEAVMPALHAGMALGVGVGKTLIALSYIYRHWKAKNTLRVLVVIPKLTIVEVWQKEAQLSNCDYLLKNITFSTYLSLHKQPNNYDVVILEEAHNTLISHHKWLSVHKGKILGLTGTPPRDGDSEKGKMMKLYYPIAYTYVMDEAVNDKILNDYRIIIHPVELSEKKDIKVTFKDKKTGKDSTFYTSEANSYKYLNKRIAKEKDPEKQRMAKIMRMKEMMTFESKERYAQQLMEKITEKCIVFCNTKEQADRLCAYTYYSGNPKSEANLRLFNEGKVTQLATILQLVEGINIKRLKQAIILHCFANERRSSQRIGRLMRLSPEETATVHILCYQDSIDQFWIKTALSDFDQTKIKYL